MFFQDKLLLVAYAFCEFGLNSNPFQLVGAIVEYSAFQESHSKIFVCLILDADYFFLLTIISLT